MVPEDIDRLARDVRVRPDAQVDQRILAAAEAALDERFEKKTAVKAPPFWRVVMNSPITKLAIAAAFIGGLTLLTVHLIGGPEKPGPMFADQPGVEKGPLEQASRELARAKQLFEQRDVRGLMDLLTQGTNNIKVTVAEYLGEIGDAEALPVLLQFADLWQGPETENPFLKAVGNISDRLSQGEAGPSDADATNELMAKDTGISPVLSAPDSDKDNEQEGVLGLKVVDKHTGKALAGASLAVTFEQNGSTYQAQTNQFGRVAVNLTEEQPSDLSIVVRQDGYVSTQLRFQPRLTGIPVPENHVLGLEKGVKVSGLVRTQDGRPATDIDLRLSVLYHGRWDGVQRQFVHEACTTNAKGRWFCDTVPLSASDVYLSVQHPEYVIDSGSRASIESLLAGSHIVTVGKALHISGRVTDSAGTPIADARIFLGNDPRRGPQAQTDTDGLFKIDKVSAERQLLSVVAKGYAQDMQVIQIEKDMEPVTFVLEPGCTITAQIADGSGHPIEGALIAGDRWREVPRHDRTSNIRLSGRSDAQGLLVIDDAPRDEVLYSISKTGYANVHGFAMSPADETYQIVLTPIGKLTGGVFDSKTKQPVSEFTVEQGVEWDAGKGPVWQGLAQVVRTGPYSVPLHYERIAVRIIADGYLPAQTPVFVNDGTVQVCDVYLQKGSGIYGTVYMPEGSPAKGADVVVATQDKPVNVSGMTYERTGQVHVTTDANGLFSLPPIEEVFRLVVLHPSGMAEVDGQVLEAGADIVLQPWGRIDAHVELDPDTKRLPEVALHMPVLYFGGPIINYARESRVDEQGNVVFDKVRPGYVRVSKGLRHADGSMNWDNPQCVEVLAGETVFVDFAAKGREVHAQLVPAQGQPVDLARTVVHLKTQVDLSVLDLPDVAIPEDLFCMTDGNWQRRLLQGDLRLAVRARLMLWQKLEKVYNGHVHPDGEIQCSDVVPGRYNLTALYKDPRTSQRFGAVLTGTDIPDGDVRPPLDLGTLEMVECKRVAEGEPAPDFQLDNLSGGQIQLSDYKGKFLLIERGGPISESNYFRDILPHLQAVYEAFGDTGQLEILSVSPAWSIAALDLKPQFEYFVTAKSIPWKMGKAKVANLGGLTPMLRQYKHKFVLVGPDATILATANKNQATQLVDIVRRAIEGDMP